LIERNFTVKRSKVEVIGSEEREAAYLVSRWGITYLLLTWNITICTASLSKSFVIGQRKDYLSAALNSECFPF